MLTTNPPSLHSVVAGKSEHDEQKILTTENTEKKPVSIRVNPSAMVKYNKDRQQREEIINPVNPVKEEENIYHFVSCG